MSPRIHRRLITAFFVYVAALLSMPSPARSEDIDIFMKNPLISTQRPNVLIILDTSANWAATDTVAADGTNLYQNVRTELAKTIRALKPDLFRVGLMIYAETGTGNDNIDGGVVRIGVQDLNSSNQEDMAKFFETIDANFDKTNNTSMGLAFYEAYLYYSGMTGYAGIGKVKRDFFETRPDPSNPPHDHAVGTTGNQQNNNPTLKESLKLWGNGTSASHALRDRNATVYQSPISDVCQKNFIIYIANGTVTDPNSANALATQKLSDQGGNTTTINLPSPDDENESNVTDEWARFLATTGVQSRPSDPTNFPTRQKVITFTVEVNAQTDVQGRRNTKLLQSVGGNDAGQGGYVSACTKPGSPNCNGNNISLSDAMNNFFNQIIDRNSIFAAATLPASSNVRGTFLNQVYMGVFRPDPNASPRWPGNLKQYKLASGVGGTQFLADKNNQPISDAFGEEGFIRPDVTSIWTIDQPSPNGFWDPVYYPDTKSESNPTASDAPDGAFVEKGGAAQHLRMAYATNVTTRRLFTCVSCANNTILPDSTYPGTNGNAFDKSNTTNITAESLGLTPPKTVTSLTRVAGSVTAVSTAHGFSNGQLVTIAGATPAEYNVARNIVVVDANRFTYSIDELPASPATAAGGQTLTASSGGLAQTLVFPNGLTRSGTRATATTSAAHNFTNGQSVIISGANDAAYNITAPITVTGSNTFEYTVTTTPVTPPTSLSAATAFANGQTRNISTLVRNTAGAGTTVTVTVSGNLLNGAPATGPVTIANVSPVAYNGTFTYTKINNTSFTYVLPSSGPPSPDPSASITVRPAVTLAIESLSRGAGDASGLATAFVTTTTAHTFNNGDPVTISGALQPQYNGTFTVANSNQAGRTFTYTISTAPASPAAGSITAQGGAGITRDGLIDWIRGTNVQELNQHDNPSGVATSVRGYLHGDVLHSRPVVINYNRLGEPQDRDIAVFYGANDGIVHAVKGGSNDADGNELWGFIPSEFFGRFTRLLAESPIITTSTPRVYFADGPITANTVYNDYGTVPNVIQRLDGVGASKAQIFIGMRRGGRFYYSLGVTNPTVPVFKWKIDNATQGFAELGQTWSEARVAKINVQVPPATAAASRRVLVFGGGYDATANDSAIQGTATMGRAIYVVDADTGALIWATGPDATISVPANATYLQTAGMTYAIPSSLSVIDSDSDVGGFADRIYAPDTGGNIWRVNIVDPNPANWTVRKVAQLSGLADNQKRKFLSAPSVVNFDETWDSILVGTGDRENPFDTTVRNRFYMIKDLHSTGDNPSLPVVTDPDDSTVTALCDLTGNAIQADPNSTAAADARACLADSNKRGWKIRLTTAGEKVVTSATTLAGTTFFGTSTLPEAPGPGQCSSGLGKAFVYAVSYVDATAVVDLNGDGVVTAADQSAAVGLGFPANPTAVVDEKGQESVIVPPGVFKPSAIAVGQRYRVFWNLSVDN